MDNFKDFITEAVNEQKIKDFFSTAKNKNGYFSDILRDDMIKNRFKGDSFEFELSDGDKEIEKITEKIIKSVISELKKK